MVGNRTKLVCTFVALTVSSKRTGWSSANSRAEVFSRHTSIGGLLRRMLGSFWPCSTLVF